MIVSLCLHAPGWWSLDDVAIMLVSDWRSVASLLIYRLRLVEFGRCLLCTASNWRSLTMFVMYSLQVAEFNDVCYVQPPVGGVWQCFATSSSWWSYFDRKLNILFSYEDPLFFNTWSGSWAYPQKFKWNILRHKMQVEVLRGNKVGKEYFGSWLWEVEWRVWSCPKTWCYFLDSCVPALKENFSLEGGVDLYRLVDWSLVTGILRRLLSTAHSFLT